jgi:signal transduction histidine kinase/CheY-like chemotaxis protein
MVEPSPAPTDMLAPMALERARILAPVMLISMFGWLGLLALTGRMTITLAVVNVVMCSVVALVVLVSRRALSRHLGHALCAVLWWAPVTCTLVAAWVTPAPLYATILPLEIIGTVVLLDTRWVVGSLLATVAIWVPLTLHGGNDAAMFILTAVTAVAFAITMQILMRRAILREATSAASLAFQLTERTRLEQQLLHSQRMEAVGTLAAGLAHDMNNVLASITTFAGLLDDEVRSESGRADLHQIIRQSLRGAELTRGLLAFSQRGQYRKQTIRVDDIVLEILPMLERTLPRSIVLRHELEGAKVCVEGDPVQLGQALINLGINAADAMNNHGTLVIATWVVELGQDAATALELTAGRYALLRVSDTGCGMDDATRRRVFEPFFTTKPAGKGTGLGLSTAWGIAKTHHGTISVASTEREGSTFCIYVPAIDATIPSRSLPVITRSTQIERICTVLVVDDEDAVRAGTVRILERIGLSALQACNGEEALEQYRDHAAVVDLVILDMGMPVMGGAECFRKLREHGAVPVLIATGYAIDTDVQDMIARGAGLIEKPYLSKDLIREVTRMLDMAKDARRSPRPLP